MLHNKFIYIEVYLSQVEKEIFELAVSHLGYSNFTKEEWTVIRKLADDRSTIIKKADKGSGVVVWDSNDYIVKLEKQLGDKNIYQHINFSDKILWDLIDKSNTMFRYLKSEVKITEKELKYFTYKYQKATNLGKMYLLPKIHKRLSNVPGRPVISSCGTSVKKISEFLDFQLSR